MQTKIHDGDKLTYQDIEDFLAKRGIAVSRVAIRLWQGSCLNGDAEVLRS